jgi:hypothetical protein
MKKPNSTNKPPVGTPSFGAASRIAIDPEAWKRAMEETERKEAEKIKLKVPTVFRGD